MWVCVMRNSVSVLLIHTQGNTTVGVALCQLIVINHLPLIIALCCIMLEQIREAAHSYLNIEEKVHDFFDPPPP